MELGENLEEVDILAEPFDYERYCVWEREHFKAIPMERREKLCYALHIIYEFAESYKMTKLNGYRYLKRYGGMDYIFANWRSLYKQGSFFAVREIFKICERNGGMW